MLSNFVSPYLRKHIKYVPRTSHTNNLGNFEAFAEMPTKRMELAVGDDSGTYELSEIAGRHWLEIALAAIPPSRSDWHNWTAAFGYKQTKVDDVAKLLAKSKLPLVELSFEGKPWLVAVAGTKKIISDVDIGPSSSEPRRDGEGGRRGAVAESKKCECFLCQSLRKR